MPLSSKVLFRENPSYDDRSNFNINEGGCNTNDDHEYILSLYRQRINRQSNNSSCSIEDQWSQKQLPLNLKRINEHFIPHVEKFSDTLIQSRNEREIRSLK